MVHVIVCPAALPFWCWAGCVKRKQIFTDIYLPKYVMFNILNYQIVQ